MKTSLQFYNRRSLQEITFNAFDTQVCTSKMEITQLACLLTGFCENQIYIYENLL